MHGTTFKPNSHVGSANSKKQVSKRGKPRVALAAAIPFLAIVIAGVVTAFALISFYLKRREGEQSTTDTDSEVAYYLATLFLTGFAFGCWTFVLYVRFGA